MTRSSQRSLRYQAKVGAALAEFGEVPFHSAKCGIEFHPDRQH